MTFGVDYAWFSTDLKSLIPALKARGVTFVARYLSTSPGKNLTLREAQALSDAGISIVLVWETTAQRSLAGRAAGVADAKAARGQATNVGMPVDRPIYFAVDFDASSGQEAAISAYLDGAASVLGKAGVGVYGGFNVVKHALDGGHCHWAWQTYAWSGGQWDGRAQIRQYSNDHIIGGVGLDYDSSQTADFGQWRIGVTPTPPPGPKPTEEDDMPTGVMASHGVTPVSLPRGRYKTVGLLADNGVQGAAPELVRVAVHRKAGWKVETVTVDSKTGQTVVTFDDPATTDGVSLMYAAGAPAVVPVAFEVS